MQMRLVLTLVTAMGLTAALTSCSTPPSTSDRVQVVTSFYPLEEAVSRVGGGLVDVTDLTPPGVEPHDLELKPSDLSTISSADLLLYFGSGFQPAVEDAAGQVHGTAVDLLSSAGGSLRADPEGELNADPHVWLDPARYIEIVRATEEALAQQDPGNAATYGTNADAFVAQLETLSQRFADVLSTCRQRLLVTGHEAFGYLASAYGLRQVGVAGVSPEAEPGPQRLADIRDLVIREGVTTVYAEELLPPDVIDTIAAETGAQVEVLHPIETLTDEQRSAGEDYGSLMRENLAALRQGLGCG
jgi:zinc transport system substrate-binding protein